MKLLMITKCSDPYEPSATVALCTSVEHAKALGFRELWEYSHRSPLPNTTVESTTYRELISGAEYTTNDGTDYPQPMVEWVETDQIIGDHKWALKLWYKSKIR